MRKRIIHQKFVWLFNLVSIETSPVWIKSWMHYNNGSISNESIEKWQSVEHEKAASTLNGNAARLYYQLRASLRVCIWLIKRTSFHCIVITMEWKTYKYTDSWVCIEDIWVLAVWKRSNGQSVLCVTCGA